MTTLTRETLRRALDEYLRVDDFRDYAPNGLQVEGAHEIRRIVTGVSANRALLDAAAEAEADAVLVHHGFFWKNEPRTLTGIRAGRVRILMKQDMSLFGYHLPLDAHPEVGNNVGLLRALGAEPTGTFAAPGDLDGWVGTLDVALSGEEVVARVSDACGQPALSFLHGPESVRTIGVCTGGGAGFFEHAVAHGVDLFVTGEPAEWSSAQAAELGANFVSGGHHATERFGPRALGEWIADRFDVDVRFIDVANPV